MTTHQPTLFEQPNTTPDPVNPPVTPDSEPASLNRWERLDVLSRGPGFFPTTSDEMDEAFNLLSFEDVPGKTAAHLNEILRHQQKARTDKPERAVRSVITEYDGYARRSLTDYTHLKVLREEIQELVNPRVSLSEEIGTDLTGPVRKFIRYIDLRRYYDSKGREQPGFDVFKKADSARTGNDRIIIDQYSVTDLPQSTKAHMTEVLNSTSVKDSRRLIDDAVEDQAQRLSFWSERLKESRAHSLAKPIADRALTHLGLSE